MYTDASKPIPARVEDLISRMTLEEKVAQLCGCWHFDLLGPSGYEPGRMESRLAQGIGQVSRLAGMSPEPPAQTAAAVNTIQHYLLESTRLGIPAIFHEECLCGYQASQGTVFPQAIGLAATWDPELVRRMTDAIRLEMLAAGARQGLAPVLDITRDPRWGRTEETFGEDPYLASAMGKAYVQGLQGERLSEGVMATAKHFIGYGCSEGGLNWAPAHVQPRERREVFARPFETAIREAGLASVMNAYNEIDGIPCTVSRELLTDFLRGQLGFQGLLVSDYMAIESACHYHRVARDFKEAGIQALRAGMDVELPSATAYSFLTAAVRDGLVDEATVDASVRRMLEAKFRLGLFEKPYVDTGRTAEAFGRPEAADISHRLALESMTLLKNQDSLLPLGSHLKKIAVIGPLSDSIRCLLGDYNYVSFTEGVVGTFQSMAREAGIDPAELGGFVGHHATAFSDFMEPSDEEGIARQNYGEPTILEAVRSLAGDSVTIRHARGCGLNCNDRTQIQGAIDAARASDIAVLVLGGKSGLDGSCTCGETRDSATLDLPGVQQELLEAVHATGTPVVLVVVSGRPLALAWAAENIGAILLAWVPGQEGGRAVADILFGRAAPGGRLPMSVPRSVGQVPVYHGHKPSGCRSQFTGHYADLPASPLYPFGYGLGYTSFEYGQLRISPEDVESGGTVHVSCNVRNTGQAPGDEVVQLYVHDREAEVTRPMAELAGFCRLHLRPGETRTVSFALKTGQLAFCNTAMELVVEPGNIDVMVGASSEDIRLMGEFRIIGRALRIEGARPLTSEARHHQAK